MSALAAASPQTDDGAAEAYAARLYEQHRRAVFGLCYKQLRRREDADDAVQTTFVYALLSLRRGVAPELELPWLFTIAHNVCSTRRRAGIRRGAHEFAHDLDEVQHLLASPERFDEATTEDFAAVLRAIPERQRQALLLREWRGLSYEEIGAELGLSQSATETLLFRARQNVAQRLRARTGLRAALQGFPLLSSVRRLLESAAAKTTAVGACAVLTVAALPAAHEQRNVGADTPPRQTPTVEPARPRHAHQPTEPVRRGLPVPPPARNDVRSAPKARHGRPPSRHGDVAVFDAPAVAAANTGAPEAATPSAPPPAADGDTPPPEPLPRAGGLVQTGAHVGESLDLPDVSLPEVQAPPVTVPLPQAPTVPAVQLPAVQLP
jgi:RNA polymerase sigma-70 factor (ECF subfamily)